MSRPSAGLGLLKLADTVLILINPSPSNVKKNNGDSGTLKN